MVKGKKRDPIDDVAIGMLIEDHRKVQALFEEFEELGDKDAQRKDELVRETCLALTAHAQLEEECFYPVIKQEIDDPDLVAEAQVEHDVAKQLIEQLESGDLDDETRDATFKVLSEYVGHHVQEEEEELFREVTSAGLDTSVLAADMQQRKQEIEAELGIAEPADEVEDESGIEVGERPLDSDEAPMPHGKRPGSAPRSGVR